MTGGRVRLATAEDVAEIEQIAQAAYKPFTLAIGRPPAPMADDFAAAVRAERVLVWAEAGRILGYLIGWPQGGSFHISNLAVDPAAQGRGVGHALMWHAEKSATEAGCKALDLYTNAVMTGALALYPRLGFLEIERRVDDGFHRVYFEKALT